MAGSFIKVAGKNEYDYGFTVGDNKDQLTLRQSAIDVTMISLNGAEKLAVIEQFKHLPYNPIHDGALVYYGDMAKFVARHLVLYKRAVNN